MKYKFSTGFLMVSICALSLLFACDHGPEYDIVPQITFKSYQILTHTGTGRDSCLNLVISFVDGDGDLGLTQEDTVPPFSPDSPYYYNLYAYYFENVDGKYIQVRPEIEHIPYGDTIRYKYRFDDLRTQSNNKALKGEIKVSINDIKPVRNNMIKFQIFIYDRALHKSNTVESPAIVYNP